VSIKSPDCVDVCAKIAEKLLNIGVLGPGSTHKNIIDALDRVEIIRMGQYVPQNNVEPLEE
jgi:Tfp pilus assembly protein PilP